MLRKRISGLKVVFGGVPHSGWIPPGAVEPKPTPVNETVLDLRVEENDGAFFLFGQSSNPKYLSSDSWHRTIDDALEAAERKFGVKLDDWSDA